MLRLKTTWKYLLIVLILLLLALGGYWWKHRPAASPAMSASAPASKAAPTADKLPPAIKVAFGADPNKEDTDGDGLTDEFEIRYGFPYLKPDLADTDGNGIRDGDEDNDKDGLTNQQEQALGTSPLQADTDEDGLSDFDEVNVYHTNPLNKDTDGDGIPDGREVANGSNPLVADADKIVNSVSKLGTTDIATGTVNRVVVKITGPGDLAARVTVGNAGDDLLPGQVSRRYEISLDETAKQKMQRAEITLPIVKQASAEAYKDLAIYTISPATGFWEALPSTVDPIAGTVTGTTPHFSSFVVVHNPTFSSSLSKLAQNCAPPDDMSIRPVDAVLLIDNGSYMASQDTRALRIAAARAYVAQMKPGDRAAVISYSSYEAVRGNTLTADKAVINAALDRINPQANAPKQNPLDQPAQIANLRGGFYAVEQEFGSLANLNQNRAVILFTGDDNFNYQHDRSFLSKRIPIFAVDVLGTFNRAYLQGLAAATLGAYRRVVSAAELPNLYLGFQGLFRDSGLDSDGDGLTDCQEMRGVYALGPGRLVHTDPFNADSDGDGIPDGVELGIPRWTKTGNYTWAWVVDGYSDPLKVDTDGDGISDPDENRIGTDPRAIDTDGDGLSDSDEINIYETNPLVADTDNDGMNDGDEVACLAQGFDPNIFDYRINSSFRAEFFEGLIKGDAIDINTTPKLIGQIVSGLLVFGDVRDLFINLFKGDWLSAGINTIGLVPAAGDVAKTAAVTAKYLGKYPYKIYEVLRYISRFFPEQAAKPLALAPGDHRPAHAGQSSMSRAAYHPANVSLRPMPAAWLAADPRGERGGFAHRQGGFIRAATLPPIPAALAKLLPALPKASVYWGLRWAERGKELEKVIAAKLPGTALLGNYRIIDVFDRAAGRAVSIKTLDIDAKSYLNLPGFKRTIERYADQLKGFKEGQPCKLPNGEKFGEILPKEIKSRELHMVFPRELSKDFALALEEVAQVKGISIVISIL